MADSNDAKNPVAHPAHPGEDPVRAQNEALARPGAYKTNNWAAYTPAGLITRIWKFDSSDLGGTKPAY